MCERERDDRNNTERERGSWWSVASLVFDLEVEVTQEPILQERLLHISSSCQLNKETKKTQQQICKHFGSL